MTRKITLLLLVTFCALSHAQDELVLPYNATTLTEEQRALNPTYLAYPTAMADEIPAQQCSQPVQCLGPFSVSATKQVCFSPGNLQYNAALGSHLCADGTTQPGTWRFAEHQYDYVGDATNGNVSEGGVKCDNSKVSSSYSGWIDLFGWGTSGWNSGANAYQPYSTSTSYSDYYPGGSSSNNLTGEYAKADWGVYNKIGDDPAGTWRTLTYDEWNYLFNTRTNAANLKGHATVNGVKGFLLLPDGWEVPSGLTFTAGTGVGYDTNTYSLVQWNDVLEPSGAVFLPVGGYRSGGTVHSVHTHGHYWSATAGSSIAAWDLHFTTSYAGLDLNDPRYGFSVRPVKDVPKIIQPHPFSVSTINQVYFSSGNLQYQASTNKWRFAEHQYDYVGDATQGNVYENGVKCDNSKISSTYSGWIDLFGWGTSSWNSGAPTYQPWSTNQTESDYYPGGSSSNNLTGAYARADWGVYNKIGNDQAGTWRTLTYDEWNYLFNTRVNAANLRGQATVNGVKGFILLPDGWSAPSGITFTFGTDVGYDNNVYTLNQWEELIEKTGAVFLPACGWRKGSEVNYVQSTGSYWSATANDGNHTWDLHFRASDAGMNSYTRHQGRSVRLVQDVPKHPFSVAEDRKVIFSPGNLQYNAVYGEHLCADGTTQPGTWRFAEHQWDYVGDATHGNVYWNNVKCDNSLISETYDGWIDLFGWGTSSWNSEANAYQPWSTSTTYIDYYPGGSYNNNLTGAYANADWGMYNKIGNDTAGTWRTLTYDEWNYLFNTRANAANLRGQATVNGINGLILLPDDWSTPSGITFTSGTDVGYDMNVYSEIQWREKLEPTGAVFLPAVGWRNGFALYSVQSYGSYWSTTAQDSDRAWYLVFRASSASMTTNGNYYGRSVRLVQDE